MPLRLTDAQYRRLRAGQPIALGHRRPGEMNKLEQKYSEYLESQRLSGGLALWMFEKITLRLGPDVRYTPDFFVMRADGVIEFHETKGFFRDDAKVKARVAAEMFPFRFLVAFAEKSGGWRIEEI